MPSISKSAWHIVGAQQIFVEWFLSHKTSNKNCKNTCTVLSVQQTPVHLLCTSSVPGTTAPAGKHSLMENTGAQMVPDLTMAQFYDGAKAICIQ